MSIAKGLHFIGIGGIGISALARYFLEKGLPPITFGSKAVGGWQVSGSDLVSSETIEALKKLGAKIVIGPHKTGNLPEKTEKVIYSPAVQPDNPELKRAKEMRIKCQTYPEALGELTKEHFTIAISGTHGKSTTSAMIGLILIKAGLDPTVIIGTKLREFGNANFRMGKNRYLVIEADEWQASFLNYWPKIIVLTNIEKEHLDYFKDLEHILETYKEYIGHLPKEGFLVVNGEDNNIKRVLNPNDQTPMTKQILNPKSQTIFYYSHQKEAKKLREILKIPGEHNVANALAALAVARVLGIDDKISLQALSEYKGSWRRFNVTRKNLVTSKGKVGFTLINDYAHHPTEIKATLKAVREKYLYPPKPRPQIESGVGRAKKEIWCFFQPHQYQRTFYLFDDFVRVFKNAPVDKLIITDIYDVAGRENKEIKEKISSQKLVKAICGDPDSANLAGARSPQSLYLAKEKIIPYLKKNLKGGEVVILMGAGDIYDLNKEF